LAPGQRLAAGQLTEIADRSDGSVELVRGPYWPGTGPSVVLDVVLDCTGIAVAPAGVRLRPRELFSVEISPEFPFVIPQVRVSHARWAAVPHVQWGKTICLYAAPVVEWVPADGMRGLLERLISWLRRAAAGDLDPAGQPLHPPVAYGSLAAGVVVVRPDLPPADPDPGLGSEDRPRLLIAVCRQKYEGRIDVTEWITPQRWQQRYQTAELDGSVQDDGYRILGAAAVVLPHDIGFEYPDKADALLTGLHSAGVDSTDLLGLLGTVAAINARLDAASLMHGQDVPVRLLSLFVGTPSRRLADSDHLLTHLVCWQLDQVGQKALVAARQATLDDSQLPAEVGSWLNQAPTTWIPVMEARPEVTCRRDAGSSAGWLAGKRVLILGSGALGAPTAEICVRADATEVTIADNGIVQPGILVRQPYEDADIGLHKATVLARRLNRVHADQRVSALPQDIITTILTNQFNPAQFDLIIDAAANASVTAQLEYRRAHCVGNWPPVITMLLGHDARRGVVTLSRPGASGAGRDVLRKLGLAACGDQAAHLADVRDDFYPDPPRRDLFQPEPGCSDPTFTGSAAETMALTASLMTPALDSLTGRADTLASQPMAAAAVRLDAGHDGEARPGTTWVGWANDLTVHDEATGYQVRLSHAALREIHAETARGTRVRGRMIETGGMLLGEIDDACRCIWIDTATGPPPDSRLSATHFEHGTQGVQELLDHYRTRSHQITAFAGMWHTHPDHAAQPSPTDTASMQRLLASLEAPSAVMIILGGLQPAWTSWLHHGEPPSVYAQLTRYDPASVPPSPSVPDGHTDNAWPGGYSISLPDRTRNPSRLLRLTRLWRSWRTGRKEIP
jgi:integrative and conjugative element protein (TIGR02256 family)